MFYIVVLSMSDVCHADRGILIIIFYFHFLASRALVAFVWASLDTDRGCSDFESQIHSFLSHPVSRVSLQLISTNKNERTTIQQMRVAITSFRTDMIRTRVNSVQLYHNHQKIVKRSNTSGLSGMWDELIPCIC